MQCSLLAEALGRMQSCAIGSCAVVGQDDGGRTEMEADAQWRVACQGKATFILDGQDAPKQLNS